MEEKQDLELLLVLNEIEADSSKEKEKLNDFLQVVIRQRLRVLQLEEFLKTANQAVAIAEQELMAMMAENNIQKFTDQYGINWKRDNFISVKVNDTERQIEWLKENGLKNIIKQTVHSSTFAALIRNDYLAKGEKIPEFVDITKIPVLYPKKETMKRKIKIGGHRK